MRTFTDMKRFNLAALALSALLLLPALPAAAHSFQAGEITIGHPWIRAAPIAAKVAGGFLTLENRGETADRLLAVEVAFAGRTQLHSVTLEGDVMQMRPLPDGVEIPPGSTVTLAPGGLHIMFLELSAPLTEGEHLPGTLIFEKAGRVEVEFTVEPLGAPGSGHDHHGHEEHGDEEQGHGEQGHGGHGS